MAGKSEHQAVKAFVTPIGRAVHCFTKADLRPTGYKSSDEDAHILLLNGGEPAPLNGCGLALDISQWFRIVEAEGKLGPYKVTTVGYQYILSDAASGDERITFHWHRTTGRPDPHVHVAGPDKRLHIPTGRIAIEQVLMLAEEMGATPFTGHWRKLVAASLSKFEKYRTWGMRPT